MKKHLVFFVVNDVTYDQRMIRICTTLCNAGFQVTLVGRKLPGSIPLKKQPFSQTRLRCLFLRGPLFYFEYNLRIFFHLIFSPYDAFCACDLDTALPVHLAGFLKRKVRIFDAHEFFSEVPELMHRPVVRGIWKWIGRISVPHFHLRYTVNHPLAKQLEARYGAGFEIVRNLPVCEKGTTETVEAEGKSASPDQRIILYQGALNAGRGLEQVVRAMPGITDKAILWLVGEGDLSHQLRAQVRKMGLSDRVVFHGKKTPEELRQMTPMATIGLNLLINDSLNYYYSLANKFFDYMCAGVPSVNMCFPAYTGILEQYPFGICISSLDPVTITQEINELLQDDMALSAMRDAARSASQVFSWSAEAGKLTDLYRPLFN